MIEPVSEIFPGSLGEVIEVGAKTGTINTHRRVTVATEAGVDTILIATDAIDVIDMALAVLNKGEKQ